MKIRIAPFIEFAYGDRRKDRASVNQALLEMKKEYDPAKDRYKQFREALSAYESGSISEAEFKEFHKKCSKNKQSAYKLLSANYLESKEDHGLTWQGPHYVSAILHGLEISTSWYLRTEASNLQRVVFLNFRKNPYPRTQERGLLTLMQLAESQSAGVGILNIQPSTLVVKTRLDATEVAFLEERAKRFVELADN